MRKPSFFSLLLLGMLSAPASAQERLDAEVTADITVLADPSLTVPLVRIARRYGERFNLPVSTSFGSSKNHVEQIKEGLDGDVFITAKALWMQQLQQEGLMDVYSRTAIARNRLVIVAPPTRRGTADSLSALSRMMAEPGHETLFALGNPEYVAEGTYTLETLSHYKLSGSFEPYFSIMQNSFSLKNLIAKYDAFGAIFATDALLYPDIVSVEQVEDTAHQPITYQGAVVVGENMDQAGRFLNFLKGEEAQGIFRQYGFLSPY